MRACKIKIAYAFSVMKFMVVNTKVAKFRSRFISLCVTTGVTASLGTTFPTLVRADVVYNGVGAGDATTNSVVLWTRATDTTQPTSAVNLTLQVAADSGFSNIVSTIKGTTNANKDYTWKSQVPGLQSGTRYYYRFASTNGTYISPVGTFKTAPPRNQQVAVHFGFSGDADGQWRPYSSLQNFSNLNLDFFVFLGDTIYETQSAISPAAADPLTKPAQALADYHRKYLENLTPVKSGGFPSLQTLFSASGHYTLLDNHELNKQFINGGAPAGSPPGAGVDATNPQFDVNTTGTYINKTPVFNLLEQAYSDYQPILERKIAISSDPRTDNTQLLFFAQQWGANCIFINLDDRSYRDIRMKTAAGADDVGPRANNPNRTMLGQSQLAWLEKTLLQAQANGTTWKVIAISSPIDEIGQLGTIATLGTVSDGGKSWMGGYRAERNALLKYIADNHIKNVVFLSTDDHQVRTNELAYFKDINNPSAGRVVVPNTFLIVAGPIGAGGPDAVTDHSFSNIQSLANTVASKEQSSGVNPIGLDSQFPGLQNVFREGDPNANTLRQPVDFYSPDTFNYATLDISADGKTLTVNTYGINSYAANTFPEPNPVNNPVRRILGFQVQAQ